MGNQSQGPRKKRRWISFQPVSKYFRFDWNYILLITRWPLLVKAAPVVFTGGLATQFLDLSIKNLVAVIFWAASTLFVFGWLLVRIRAPIFLQEYRNYKEYEDCRHSHRWIVWNLYHLYSTESREQAAREAVDKDVAYSARANLPGHICSFFPIFYHQGKITRVDQPIQIDRDIYLPFLLDGVGYVLPMQESDPKLADKQKELFWIINTRSAKARPISRTFVWVLFISALAALIAAALIFGYVIVTAKPETVVRYI